MVYFIEADGGENKFIKIGYSKAPEERLKRLQGGCPLPLKLLFSHEGGKKDEASFKTRFSFHNLHDEWFLKKGSLKEYISNNV